MTHSTFGLKKVLSKFEEAYSFLLHGWCFWSCSTYRIAFLTWYSTFKKFFDKQWILKSWFAFDILSRSIIYLFLCLSAAISAMLLSNCFCFFSYCFLWCAANLTYSVIWKARLPLLSVMILSLVCFDTIIVVIRKTSIVNLITNIAIDIIFTILKLTNTKEEVQVFLSLPLRNALCDTLFQFK